MSVILFMFIYRCDKVYCNDFLVMCMLLCVILVKLVEICYVCVFGWLFGIVFVIFRFVCNGDDVDFCVNFVCCL